jgi:hypothetical protein
MIKRFWILGSGQFGKIAISRILRAFPAADLTVVDKNPDDEIGHEIQVIHQDGIRWLWTLLGSQSLVDMIVPAIPVHVAYEWLVLAVEKRFDVEPINIPKSWQRQMPHPVSGKIGQVYMSHADFICPDNCPEPKDSCTVTKKPRPKDLFKLLQEVHMDDALPIIVRSHQILPGVGGLYADQLSKAFETAVENFQHPLFMATACKCHGVGNAFRLRRKRTNYPH